MVFQKICVGIVVILFICIVTLLIGVGIESYKHDEAYSDCVLWLISSIGFGVCLTIILYQNGVIK